GSAKIAAFFDNANVGDSGLLEAGRRQQTSKPSTYHHGRKLFVQGGACKTRLDIWIRVVSLERTGDFLGLVVPVGAQTLLTLFGVFSAQISRIEAQLFAGWNSLHFRLY